MYSYGPPHMVERKQDDQLEPTFSSYVRIRNVALKTCQKRWTIGRSSERGSGISVLAARHDDDNDDDYVPLLFQPSGKVKVFSQLFASFHSHSVVCWLSKILPYWLKLDLSFSPWLGVPLIIIIIIIITTTTTTTITT